MTESTQNTVPERENSVAPFRIETETMPNGELRVRLVSPDGNNYIRTQAGCNGGWQNAHYHDTIRETYVVENGWMAYATENQGGLSVSVLWAHDIVTTQPREPHNIYLPVGAVIHTIKHGSTSAKDWMPHSRLTGACATLSEKRIHELAASASRSTTNERHFDAYVELYNNLDRLLWGIPSLLAVAATVLIGFSGNLLSRDQPVVIPPVVFAMVCTLIGTLFAIGSYSIWRLRRHHTLVGNELAKMEHHGYFVTRQQIVESKWPPSAPSIIGWIYAILASFTFSVAVLALFKYELLVYLAKWTP